MADRSLCRTSCSINAPRSDAVLDELQQIGRRFSRKPEPLECEAVARIVDPDGESRKLDERVDGWGRHAHEPPERGHGNEPVAYVLVDVAVIERGGRPDGLVRLALLAGA